MVVICMESAGMLAGPMSRQADTDSVVYRKATDRPAELDAAIYQLDTFLPLKTATKMTSVPGHRLFIPPVWVRGQYPMEKLLGYDLFFRIGTIMFDLESFDMINEDSTTSGGLPYPLLFIPANAAPNFRILLKIS
jgi:hypothetical protein